MQNRYRNRYYQERRHNILYIWLLSYLVICLILSCCSIALYSSLVNTTQDYIEQQQKDFLNKIALQFDSNISFTNRLYSSLSSNSNVSSLIYSDLPETELTMSAIKLSRELSQLLSTTKFSDAYIYFSDKNKVIGTSHSGTPEEFYAYYYNETDLSYEDWITRIQSPNFSNYISLHGESNTYIDIMYQLPKYVTNSYVHATLVIRMSDTVLKELTYNNQKIGYVAIIDQQNRLIMTDSTDLPILRNYESYSDDVVYTEDDIVTVCQTSSRNGWKYLYFANNSQFYHKLKSTRYTSIAFMWLSLIFCCVLGIWFSFKNYHPLNNLIKTYKMQAGLKSDTPNNYKIMNEALSDYISSKQNLYILEKQKHQSYITNYLQNLLTGTPAGDIPDGLNFPSNLFSVIIFNPYGNEKMLADDNCDDTRETKNITFFIIQNIMEELLNKNDFCKILQLGNRVVAVYCYANEQNASVYKNTLYSALTYGLSIIKNNFQFGCDVGISSVRNGTESLIHAFNEADLTLDGNSSNAGEISFYDELYRQSLYTEKTFFNSFTSYKNNLIDCIKARDIENAQQILDKILRDCTHSLNITKTKVILLHLESTILSVFDLSDESDSDVEILGSMNFDNLSDSFKSLKSLVTHICTSTENIQSAENNNDSAIPTGAKSDKEAFLTRMIDYVRENYSDCNLNVNAIGENFNLSSYYISKIFKNATGESLSDFIARLRIEKAKTLLKIPDMSTTEVYEQCGFANEKTFTRTFSKYEALTPSKYRKMHNK